MRFVGNGGGTNMWRSRLARPFISVAEWLAGTGLTAPEILARDLEKGLLLLGDFGSALLRETLDTDPHRERELYETATDVLIHLHDHPPMQQLKPHGLGQWLEELQLFTGWYCPAVGAEVDLAGYDAAWRQVLDPVANDGLGPVTVLRDYHAENIMLVEGREGVAHFGLLDFQDALAGHPAYDLASVLEDARRDVSPAIERASLSSTARPEDALPVALGCFLVIGPVEELAKFLAVRLYIFRDAEFDEPLDGIIYA